MDRYNDMQALLDAYKEELKKDFPDVVNRDTVAIGVTDIEGLNESIFEGASPEIRKGAGLPALNPNRPIQAPYNSNQPGTGQYTRHAEEGVLNEFIVALQSAGINNDVKGTLYIHQSNASGACFQCTLGLIRPNNNQGIFQKFSSMYPNITIKLTSEFDPAVTKCGGTKTFELINGKMDRITR